MTLPSRKSAPLKYKRFDIQAQASLALDHLTGFVDPALDCLPYGQVVPFTGKPFAEHSRQDDAEFIASWFEAISCTREILSTTRGKDVEDSLRKQLLETGWEKSTGLRYPKRRPWTGDLDYCVLSEMSVVLSALNRMIELDPDDRQANARADALIAGLHSLATPHTRRLTPQGVFPLHMVVYSFPGDVVIHGKGFVSGESTGFSDSVLRNATLIHPLMVHYELKKDETSLDLAVGLANYLTGLSHFFSNKTEFQGEVHSALQTAAGLARIGRVLSQDRYVARAKSLYDYVRRNGSSFGWVPEHLQWQLMSLELCDATAVADMMLCGLELVDCSFPEYWDDVHRFMRNHLAQSQIDDVSFIPNPADPPKDTPQRTYDNIGQRLRGAFCSNSCPDFVPLVRDQYPACRAFSARAAAAAPRSMLWAYRRAVDINEKHDLITINFPINLENGYAKISVGYPNSGEIEIKTKKACRINLRAYPWMTPPHEAAIDGHPAGIERRDDLIAFPKCPAGSIALFRHEMKTSRILEKVMNLDFFGLWRGPDMVDILPHTSGSGYRLYQRVEGAPRDPVSKITHHGTELKPFLEPPVSKEMRLNRRKAPRG